MSAWDKVEEEQDAIELLKLVRDVAMDKTETKQMVISYVESFLEMFLYHLGKKRHTRLLQHYVQGKC